MQGDVSFAKREARLLSLDGDRSIYTAADFYVKHPYKDLITGKEWVHFPRDEAEVWPDDRARLLPYLAAGATESTKGKVEKINGVETFRYEAKVDVQVALRAVPEVDRTLAQHVLEEELLGRTGSAKFWIDEEGRLRRIRVDVPPGRKYSRTDPNGDSISLKSDGLTLIGTTDFIEFGVDVDATPPPADQVGDPLK